MVRSVISKIPSDKSVSITPELRSFVSNRKYVHIFPRGPVNSSSLIKFGLKPYENYSSRDADYVIIDLQQNSNSEHSVESSEIQQIFHSSKYGLHFLHDGLMIFKKGKNNEEGLKNVFINREEIQGKRIDKDFGNGLVLLTTESNYKSSLRHGDGLEINLYWKINSRLKNDFKVLISMIHEEFKEKKWLHDPIFNLIKPNQWKAGDIVKDSFIIPINESYVVHYKPYRVYIDILRSEGSGSAVKRMKIIDKLKIVP